MRVVPYLLDMNYKTPLKKLRNPNSFGIKFVGTHPVISKDSPLRLYSSIETVCKTPINEDEILDFSDVKLHEPLFENTLIHRNYAIVIRRNDFIRRKQKKRKKSRLV
jgi:hypothetical protein